MADITKAVSANDIKNGTSITGVDGTGNVQTHFETAKDSTSPVLSDIQNKYDARFDDTRYYFFQQDTTLLVGLEAYYKLDEVSGTRLDSVNGTDLTDNNTVGSLVTPVAGAVGANFIKGNNEYLSVANAALEGLSPGDTDWSVACWFKLDSSDFASDQHIFGVWKTSPSNHREYMLYWKAGHTKLRFYTSGDGSSSSYLGSVKNDFVANTWYHLAFCHDAGNNLRLLYIDGNLDTSDSYSAGVYQGGGDLQIGVSQNSSSFMDGGIDEWAFWSKVLSASEAAELYNSGDGVQVK